MKSLFACVMLLWVTMTHALGLFSIEGGRPLKGEIDRPPVPHCTYDGDS